jgi:hypothetical protein
MYLSPELRAELDQRLIESAFTRFADHAEWLKSKGADISMSAIHRYSCEPRLRTVAAIRCPVGTASENEILYELRIRALDLVTKASPLDDEAFRQADRVVDWVVGTLPSPDALEGGG